MFDTKILLIVAFIALVGGLENYYKNNDLNYRTLLDLNEELSRLGGAAAENRFQQERFVQDRQYNDNDDNSEDEEYLALRSLLELRENSNGIKVTLKNHAAMNTRIRVLYVDSEGNPAVIESPPVMAGLTKTEIVPKTAKNARVIIQKDMFSSTWRDVYTVPLNGADVCIAVSGITFASKAGAC